MSVHSGRRRAEENKIQRVYTLIERQAPKKKKEVGLDWAVQGWTEKVGIWEKVRKNLETAMSLFIRVVKNQDIWYV